MAKGTVFWYLRRVIALVLALFGITFFMIYSDVIGRAFQSVANFESDPGYWGGRIAATFYDPVGDDHGYGGLVYPLHRDFAAGSLDLVRYTVHEPVYNAAWSEKSEYWQLDLSFASGPNEVRNIRIYIDADGDGQGSTSPRVEMAEGVVFDTSAPWDYVIAVQGGKGSFVSSDGTYSVPVAVNVSNGGKDVAIRVPLSDRRLHGLYRVESTRHYVCVGGWTPWGRDGFVPVSKRASLGSGGGAQSALTPNIYDYLSDDSASQEKILSSWNDETFEVPTLIPVSASMRSAASSRESIGANAAPIAALESEARDEAESAQKNALAALAEERSRLGENAGADSDPANLEKLALLAFRAGERVEAEALYDRILEKEKDNASALAYKGALIAMRGGDASPLAAVEIIAEAYGFLDRAVLLAKTPAEIFDSRLSRASVSRSVPDTIFGKALVGADDYLAVAQEYRKLAASAPAPEIAFLAEMAEAYLNAALCFETAGKDAEAGTWFREGARMVALADTASPPTRVPASIRLELARRGLTK